MILWIGSIAVGIFVFLLLRHQIFAVEAHQHYHTHRQASIGEIEYRLEKLRTSEQGHPIGPSEEREIEHIHHTAMENGFVAATGRENLRHAHRCGFVENQAVGNAVDYIADPIGTKACYDATSDAIFSIRSAGKLNKKWKGTLEEDYKTRK